MTTDPIVCRDDRRRDEVRRADVNGLDYLEVSDDQLVLSVYFLGKAPERLVKENVRIEGGRRRRGIRAVDVAIEVNPDPALDDCTHITVDRPGDFSTYTLRLVELDDSGRPTEQPLSGLDPRYAALDFSFKAACESDLDCKPDSACWQEPPEEPEIDYLAKDYASFRRLILDRLSLLVPDWKERHVPDLGIALVELFAYVGDHLSYYQDAVATEAYLDTARQRTSVRRHVRLVDYAMHDGCNARTWVHVHTDSDVDLEPADVFFITPYGDPAGGQLAAGEVRRVDPSRYEVFEPLVADDNEPIRLVRAHSEISIYTWGDGVCCLPEGATSATLQDAWLDPEAPEGQDYEPAPAYSRPPEAARYEGYEPEPERPDRRRALRLRPGDVVIFEEVLGPETGAAPDADPEHRHAVRLTTVEPAVDPLNDQPIVEIGWSAADALPFPLCVSAVGPPPECQLVEVSVARGNVVLTDHGRTVDGEDLGTVPEITAREVCGCGCPHEAMRVAGRFRPLLDHAPLTFGERLPRRWSASTVVWQDPRRGHPWCRLKALPPGDGDGSTRWTARRDLLGSGPRDRHFVAEVDDEGRARLRFGDGALGRAPEAGTAFDARYRVGNGPAGNVGADTVRAIVLNSVLTGVNLRPRNPLPGRGGTAPEPVAEVKALAPHAFGAEQQRAVAADDYARLAERHPGVQRAAAVLRGTGSWQEVLVAIDPARSTEPDTGLLAEIAGHLHPYRRMGHDVVVQPASYVPLVVRLRVCVLPDHLRGHVKRALLEVFGSRARPGRPRGYFHPDNLTFGEGVSVSRIVATAQAVPGVESVTVEQLERLFEGPNREIERGFLPLGPLEVARLDNDPDVPENGQLVIEVRGGR